MFYVLVVEEKKVLLGQRLASARIALGHPKRPSFAALLDIPADTLGSYERGIRSPEMSVLADYSERFGVNLNWIATGNGDMFDDPSKAFAVGPAINPTIFARVKDAVSRLTKEQGVYLRDGELEAETIRWYNKLVVLADGSSDEKKLASRLSTIEFDIEESARTDAEAAKSGTGKRSA